MKNKQIDFLIRINGYVFPFLVGIAFIALGLESYSYIGFLRKFILVDSRFFLVLAIISAILLKGKKLNGLSALTFKTNSIILLASSALYLMMQFLESSHFRNYIFSTYHIQPTNFFYIVFLSSVLFLISRFLKQKLLFQSTIFISLGILAMLAIAFLNGTVAIVDEAVYTDTYILSHANVSYDFKMEERWGVYYDYIKFVRDNTSENASILVPPQELPWYSTGNVGLDQYFLFPRKLDNGSYNKLIDVTKFDYVMVSWGEWNGAEKSAYGWPKVSLKAEKIIYFDPETKLAREKNKDYDPKDLTDGVWGLIKVKK